jgi:hypothetical protein
MIDAISFRIRIEQFNASCTSFAKRTSCHNQSPIIQSSQLMDSLYCNCQRSSDVNHDQELLTLAHLSGIGGGRCEYLGGGGGALFKMIFRLRNFRSGEFSASRRDEGLRGFVCFRKGLICSNFLIWRWVAIWNAYYTSMAVILLKDWSMIQYHSDWILLTR